MRVRLESGLQEITLEGPLLGRGGEASIYSVPGRTDLAAKIYHNPSEEQAGKLAAMLAAPPVPTPRPGQHVVAAWPIGRLLEVGDEGRVVGYLMPRIDNAHLIWEIYNPGVRREVYPHFHFGTLLRTARNLAAAVNTMHECGYVIGDLNESNVLVSSRGEVTLIDVDSFQSPAHDRLYRCRVGRPEYTSPELQGAAFADVDRLPQHDAFGLAVLIFQLLMQGIHPFAGTSSTSGDSDSIPSRIAAGHWPYAWTRTAPIQPSPHAPPWHVLPPSVQDLLRRCFEDAHAEPDLRPSAAQWQHGLEEAEHELANCPSDALHVYHRRLDHCPWCRLPSAVRPSAVVHRQAKAPDETSKVQQRKRKVVDDPLPPRRESESSSSQQSPGGAELVLQAIGMATEQSKWLMWVGVALLGAVAGIVYALQHALSNKSIGL
jgi:DNA-binding helix-hairpin-helix protein with protein kinase domain